jgi:hypothetical protein
MIAMTNAATERVHPELRSKIVALLASLVARGLRVMPTLPADPATLQVTRAFPDSRPLRAVSLFTVIRQCASPMLRHAVDVREIRPTWAYELCRLDHAGQDAIVALGSRATQFAAHELGRIRYGCATDNGATNEEHEA